MTLGELKKAIRIRGKRVVASAALRFSENYSPQGDAERVTVYFSGEEQITFPFPPTGGIYPLVTKTGLDNEEIHPEKVRALMRSLFPDDPDDEGNNKE
jgi:hypothetical protein